MSINNMMGSLIDQVKAQMKEQLASQIPYTPAQMPVFPDVVPYLNPRYTQQGKDESLAPLAAYQSYQQTRQMPMEAPVQTFDAQPYVYPSYTYQQTPQEEIDGVYSQVRSGK
jgi:hypothetical protein